ncbi:MAG: transglycosylase SLT domain-containing protein [Candidatus Poribacteria bacterium]|jgi:soluble lytic murein transglycosylase-like protein|nr:transglycosylase SLT domain-containing protein [Candidatus Poribacteria bacterium]
MSHHLFMPLRLIHLLAILVGLLAGQLEVPGQPGPPPVPSSASLPVDLANRKQLAAEAYQSGDLEQAIELLQSVLQPQPQDTETRRNLTAAYRMLSLKLQNQGQYQPALQAADQAIRLARQYGSDLSSGQYQRIAVLSQQGKFSLAQRELTHLPVDDAVLPAAQDLVVAAALRQAQQAVQQNNYASALELIASAARVAPQQYSHLHLQTVQILAGTGQSAKALSVLEPLSRVLPPDNPLFNYRIGSLYYQLGQWSQSAQFLQRIEADSPYSQRAETQLNRLDRLGHQLQQAQKSLAAEETEQAIHHLRQALQVDGHQHRIRLNLVKLLLQQDDHSAALAQLERLNGIAAINQDDFYRLEMGQLYTQLGEQSRSTQLLGLIQPESSHYKDAQQWLDPQLVDPMPTGPQPTTEKKDQPEVPPSPSLETVTALIQSGDLTAAQAELDQFSAQAGSIDDDRTQYEIGYLYLHLQAKEKAGSHLQQVSEDSLFYQAAQALLNPVSTTPQTQSVAKMAEPVSTPPRHPVAQKVADLAAQHQIELSLGLALIRQESNMKPHAVSRVGAAGLCQIMPPTGRDLKLKIPDYADAKKPTIDPQIDERFAPYKAMDAGFRYLRQLLNRYDGNAPLALSAYNAGMGRTKQRVARIYETTAYVADIMTFYWRYQEAAELQKAMDRLVAGIESVSN